MLAIERIVGLTQSNLLTLSVRTEMRAKISMFVLICPYRSPYQPQDDNSQFNNHLLCCPKEHTGYPQCQQRVVLKIQYNLFDAFTFG